MPDQFDSSAVSALGISLTDAETAAFDQALRGTDQAAVAALGQGPQRRALAVVEQAAARAEADRKLLANERVRSTAGFVNTIASTVLTAGVVTPAVGAFFPKSPFADHLALLFVLGGCCILGAALLHIGNRALLRGLKA